MFKQETKRLPDLLAAAKTRVQRQQRDVLIHQFFCDECDKEFFAGDVACCPGCGSDQISEGGWFVAHPWAGDEPTGARVPSEGAGASYAFG